MKPVFICLVGIPGAGKSTYIEKYESEGYVIHASDKLRAEMGDETDQSHNTEVFEILNNRIKDDLLNGKNVVCDATNLRRRNRIHLINMIRKTNCHKKCIVVATPFEECICNNASRERKVPENVLWKMLENFQMPCKVEGWDEVEVVYTKPEYEGYYGDSFDEINSLKEYDQGNSHHKLSLGTHMMRAGNWYLANHGSFDSVAIAAYMHDIGKPLTRSSKNRKGEDDGEVHYYSHHNVGSYLSLFFNMDDFPWINKQYVALLIELHMRPHLEWKQSEQKLQKDTNLFGEKTVGDVFKIHDCDLAAH